MSVADGSVTVLTPVPPPATHPTACSSWCADRHTPLRHHFGPTFTPHRSPELTLAGPATGAGNELVLLRAELFRLDEGSENGEPLLYLTGEDEFELPAPELDLFIVRAQAFVDGLRVMRGQMG